MGKTSSLADAVRSVEGSTRHGPKCFVDRLDPQLRDEVLELRREFQEGKFGTLSAMEVSRRARDVAASRGTQLVSVKEFALWLRR